MIKRLCVRQLKKILTKLGRDLMFAPTDCSPIFGNLVDKISSVALIILNKENELATFRLDKERRNFNYMREQCEKKYTSNMGLL